MTRCEFIDDENKPIHNKRATVMFSGESGVYKTLAQKMWASHAYYSDGSQIPPERGAIVFTTTSNTGKHADATKCPCDPAAGATRQIHPFFPALFMRPDESTAVLMKPARSLAAGPRSLSHTVSIIANPNAPPSPSCGLLPSWPRTCRV